MDYLENRYLVLPLHHKVSVKDAKYISRLVNKYAKYKKEMRVLIIEIE